MLNLSDKQNTVFKFKKCLNQTKVNGQPSMDHIWSGHDLEL